MMTVLFVGTVEAVAVKVAVETPASTVTEAGVVMTALSSVRETISPPVGASLLRVTVQVAAAPDSREAVGRSVSRGQSGQSG